MYSLRVKQTPKRYEQRGYWMAARKGDSLWSFFWTLEEAIQFAESTRTRQR